MNITTAVEQNDLSLQCLQHWSTLRTSNLRNSVAPVLEYSVRRHQERENMDINPVSKHNSS